MPDIHEYATVALQTIAILLAILCFVAVSVGIFQVFGRYLYSYCLSDESLDCMVLGFIPWIRIRYNEITFVCRTTFWDAPIFSSWFANRMFSQVVLISLGESSRSVVLREPSAPRR